MNKRTFLRTLGGAVLGVGLALGLKRPEVKLIKDNDVFPPNMGNCIRAVEFSPYPSYICFVTDLDTKAKIELDNFLKV